MSEDSRIPIDIGYHNDGTAIPSAWGISTTGVLLSQGLNKYGVDHFYPTSYGWTFS